jgi:non-ribosomal peptide synthase protein (TIGR01720 family)
MQELIQRLQRLTAAQRKVLAQQLHSQASNPQNTKLVAFVVPATSGAPDPARLRAALLERLPEYMLPHQIVPLDALPLTPNGKIDRMKLTIMDLEAASPATGYAEPVSEVERTMAEIWTEVLGLDLIGVHDNFFEIGGDSILSIQIVARARNAGLAMTPAMLFKNQTIAELALAMQSQQVEQVSTNQGLVTGPVPLTAIQHWFFEKNLQKPQQWNQSLLLRLQVPVPQPALLDALRALVRHHDALRTRFFKQGGDWAQELANMPSALPFECLDLRGAPASEHAALVEHTATRLSRSLQFEDESLFRCAHIRYSDSQEGLLLVIHHLLVDGISWRLLVEDLNTAIDQAMQGQPNRLPPKTSSIQDSSRQLQSFAGRPDAAAALDYWLDDRFRQGWPLPRDFAVGEELNTVDSTRVATVQLENEETRALLENAHSAYHTQINDVLLTAFGKVLSEWLQKPYACFALEGHGRENLNDNLDLTRTLGWFTSVFPLRLTIEPGGDLGQRLLMVKEQLRAVPDNGISYGLLKYSTEYRAKFSGMLEPEIVFNYLGQKDAEMNGLNLIRLESDSVGEMRFPGDRRLYLIEVNCFVSGGKFYSRWNYSRCFHEEATVQKLAVCFCDALRDLIAHCTNPEAGGRSRSDFPLADLDQESFDLIAGMLDLPDGE